MCCNNDFLNYFKPASKKIEKGEKGSEAVKQLQNILNHLGFKDELQWEKYGADGDYGNLTQKAVVSFLTKNNMVADGSFVDKTIALALEQRHNTLDELQVLDTDVDANTVETDYFYKSKKNNKVQALQTLLNELGYGKTMQWSKYKNDGDYGDLTTKAVALFAKDCGIISDGKKLTTALAKCIVNELSMFYGTDWKSNSLAELINNTSNPIAEFTASNFVGKKLTADKDFFAALTRINNYAKESDVLIHVVNSFRFTNDNLSNTVVTPATKSNHLVGHAIDMNIRYGENHRQLCNSTTLAKPILPVPVANFIQKIKNDKGLRWGGEFSKKDPVHIDDYYNQNPTNWIKKYEKIHQTS